MRRPYNALTLRYLLTGPTQDGQNAGDWGRSAPDPGRDTPQGYVSVPVGKSCVLLLTDREYTQGLKRGKRWRRTQERMARTKRIRRGTERW